MGALPDTLTGCAVAVLTTADGREKTALSRRAAAAWREGRAADTPMPLGDAVPPLRPARPAEPALVDPRDVPRRRPGSPAGRTALLHAVAHIELNAVDLHWDIIARFAATMTGPGPRTRNPSISTSYPTVLKRAAAITERYPPMPECGRRPRTRRTT